MQTSATVPQQTAQAWIIEYNRDFFGKKMQKINIYAPFRINFINPPEHADKDNWYRLDIPSKLAGIADVRFKYSSGEGSVQLYDLAVDEEALQSLYNSGEDLFFFSFPEKFMPTYREICSEVNSAARRAVEYVKYFLGRDEISDEAVYEITTFSWSLDPKADYTELPNRVTGRINDRNQLALTYSMRSKLQDGINENINPFVAMRHLYRAIQEKNPRFKWIDATIAAELAVKEALIRKEPQLAAFIEHVPSPPLQKLYGELLETYLGARSPQRTALAEGATKRNKLVHQPAEIQVTEEEAQDYVNVVMKAIHHLYALLYPTWPVATELQTLRRIYCWTLCSVVLANWTALDWPETYSSYHLLQTQLQQLDRPSSHSGSLLLQM